jgi:HEAT repeat protein
MQDQEIRDLVASMDTKDNAARENIWLKLRDLGNQIAPFFEEFFPQAKKLEARRDMAFHCIRFARESESAYRIGLLAITDKSTIVRYRGCCILAYSLRRDALPALQSLLNHTDSKTVEDARAAIDAIKSGNHHYFVDRDHSGKVRWQVNSDD